MSMEGFPKKPVAPKTPTGGLESGVEEQIAQQEALARTNITALQGKEQQEQGRPQGERTEKTWKEGLSAYSDKINAIYTKYLAGTTAGLGVMGAGAYTGSEATMYAGLATSGAAALYGGVRGYLARRKHLAGGFEGDVVAANNA